MKKTIWARVGPDVDKSVRKVAKVMGISISEYVRRLILQDLDSRKMFEDELKKAVEKSEEEETRPKTITQMLWEEAYKDYDRAKSSTR